MMFKFCPNCGTEGGVAKQNDTDYECTHCGWHFWNNAKASVAVAFVKDGKLLVSKRGRATDPNFGMYDLPGGFVDFGETAQHCAVRECKEELDVRVAESDLELVAAYHNQYDTAVFTIDLVFLVQKWEGEFHPQDDSAACEWKPLDFIYDPTFCETHYKGLNQIISAKLAKSPQ